MQNMHIRGRVWPGIPVIFYWLERPPTQFVRAPPCEMLVFPANFIFFRQNKMILWGKKRTALFQTYDWEKEKVFQRACTCICRETRKYVAGVPRPSRVDISCMSKVSGPLFLYQSYHLNNQGGRTKRGHTFESLEPNLQNLTMHRNFFQPLLRSIK